MRIAALVAVFLLHACSDATAPVEVPDPPEPEPVLRFVVQCPGLSVWWLRLDGVNLPPSSSGIWALPSTDSLDFPTTPGVHEFVWAELGSQAYFQRYGDALTDSTGATRVEVECLGF